MFSYLYWPYDWGTEISVQLKRVQHFVQIITPVADFEKMESELFRLVNRGVYVEVVVCQFPSEKTMKHVNTLKRLAASGSDISTVTLSDPLQRTEYYAILDRKLIVSNRQYEGAEHYGELIVQKTRELKHVFEGADPVRSSLEEMRIFFQCDTMEVRRGRSVNLYWEVEYADFVELDPGIGPVEASGNISVPVFEDTLFRIKAGNRSGILVKSLYVKVSDQALVHLELYVFDPVEQDYVLLQSANNPGHTYAVMKGDRLRLVWSASASGLLSERRLGGISSSGEHNFQVFHDENFTFTLLTTLGENVVDLEIIAMVERFSGELIAPEMPSVGETRAPQSAAGRKNRPRWMAWLLGVIKKWTS